MVPIHWNGKPALRVESFMKRATKSSTEVLAIIVRRAAARDFELLLELIREYYRYDGIRFSAKSIGPALRRLLRDETLGQVFLLHHGSELAGYVILTFNYDLEFGGLQGIVTDLYLREPYRGSGLGGRALDTVSEYCRRKKISVLELQVEYHNEAAQNFYRKLGFRKLPRLVMSKDL